MSPFDYVLYPRSGATLAAIKALGDKLDAVYDVTVMYCQTYDRDQQIRLAAPSMTGTRHVDLNEDLAFLLVMPMMSNEHLDVLEYLQGQTREVHIDVRRIELNEIPRDTDEDISRWLIQRFDAKDK